MGGGAVAPAPAPGTGTRPLNVLDVCSSWISHVGLAGETLTHGGGSEVGVGMNAQELKRNDALTASYVRNLNTDPGLPVASSSFDVGLVQLNVDYGTETGTGDDAGSEAWSGADAGAGAGGRATPLTPLHRRGAGTTGGRTGGRGSTRQRSVRAVRTADELLRVARPVLFVTDGGQNSIMESMSVGTPVVVCPGFGDQVSNAAKVQEHGWGITVARPADSGSGSGSGLGEGEGKGGSAAASAKAGDGEVTAVMASYPAAVRGAVREVLSGDRVSSKPQLAVDGLARAVGVEGALFALMQAADLTEQPQA